MTLEHSHTKTDIAARLAVPVRQNYLRDVVYGAIDGTVTTFAIVAGVQGAGLSPSIVITLGIANVLADGFSMAASNYSGNKAELDDRQRLRQIEEKHFRDAHEGEREELRQILAQKGLVGAVLENATSQIMSDPEKFIKMMLTDEYGLSPAAPKPINGAAVTFIAFLSAGIIPLVPYLLGSARAFEIATVITGFVFFAIGISKSKWSLAPWWKSGLETLTIGSAAALIAYVVGTLFHT